MFDMHATVGAAPAARQGPPPVTARAPSRVLGQMSPDPTTSTVHRPRATSTPVPPLVRPGGWLEVAREAIQRLGRCHTVDEVADEFGSARSLAQLLFGYPINGGHATRPMVREIGRLLHHRLGPAVATEALAVAAEVQHLIDTNTLLAILGLYCEVRSAGGTPGSDELGEVVHRVSVTPPPHRHQVVLRLCLPRRERQIGLDVLESFHSIFYADDMWRAEGPIDLPDEPSDDDTRDGDEQEVRPAFPRLTDQRDISEWQSALRATAPDPSRERAWLRQVLQPSAPSTLLIAALTMMPMAVPHRPRLLSRRVLQQLSRHPDRRVRVALIGQLRDSDLDEDVLHCLTHSLRNTTEHWLLRAATRTTVARLSAAALDERARHGELVQPFSTPLPLLDLAEWLDPTLHVDNPLLIPVLPGRSAIEHRRSAATSGVQEDTAADYRYPREVKRLHGRALPRHPDWIVRLPRHRRELLTNASLMRNCTASYHRSIRSGRRFVVMVDGPGCTCNAELRWDDGRLSVRQLASADNRPAPDWMGQAFADLFADLFDHR